MARKRWADLLAEQGRTRDAILQYVAAVEIKNDSVETIDKLARLYREVGRPEAARTEWEAALLLDPLNDTYLHEINALPKSVQ